MRTGNIRDLLVAGRRQLSITSVTGTDGYLPVGRDGRTWLATFEGWGRGNVGTGASRADALADLARQCDTTVGRLVNECDVFECDVNES